MARKSKEYLEALKKKNNVHEIFSWSRYNAYKNDPYEYYLKYIKRIPEDRKDGIYGISGSIAHDIMEKLYSKEIKYEDMIEKYEEELFKMNMAELKYDRSDEEKNKNIADKYEACLRHFFTNHNKINGKMALEKFITIWVGKWLFQGYIDFMNIEDGYYIVNDWKTSTLYSGKKIDQEKGQLVLYAEGIRQAGIPLDKIKCRWNFLKYVTVTIEQANGKKTERNIERNQIGEKLRSNIKMWLKKSGECSEEEIEGYLDMTCLTNDLKCLPIDIQAKYKIEDCYVYIPLTQECIDELKEDIIATIVEISLKEAEYNKTKDEKVWWEEITNEKSYYFANLSGYSSFLHKPYAEYLDKLKSNMAKDLRDNEDDESEEEDDLSWLNDI